MGGAARLSAGGPPTPAASTPPTLAFNGVSASRHVLAQVKLGPRPTGSPAGRAAAHFIIIQLQQAGWQPAVQPFIFNGVRGQNILAVPSAPSNPAAPVILLGAHFDTRPAADRDPTPYHRAKWIAGANDGASGVAVLLELARVLNPNYLPYNVQLAFFDAEDRGQLAGWPFSVGARYAARRLTVPPAAVVIVDMVGDANQTLYLERTSTPALAAEIWAVANSLGYRAHFIPQPKYAIIDDHLPFAERGLPAANLIDFDYPAWHTTADTVDKVSAASLERVGRTLEAWLQQPN